MRVAFNGALPVLNRPVSGRQDEVQFGLGASLGHAMLDAISDNKMDELKTHLAAGVSPNIKTLAGQNTALHVAIIYGRTEMVTLLLAQPAIKLDEKNAYGETPEQTAQRQVNSSKQKIDTVRNNILDLVKAGKTNCGHTPPAPAPEPAPAPPVDKAPEPPKEVPAPPKPELSLHAIVYDVFSTLSKTFAELADRYKPKS